MHKTKAVMPCRTKVKSPSPDSRSMNSIKSTFCPTSQVQRFLATHRPHLKLKRQDSSLDIKKQEQYIKRIQQLESEVEQYQKYMEEYQQIAKKNIKLQEQMVLILNQLQKRTAGAAPTSIPKTPQVSPSRHLNFQSSPRQSNKLYSPPPNTNAQNIENLSKEEQIQNLYNFVEDMQGTMRDLVNESRVIKSQMRNNVKKDLNDMQQRLMNYIFGLEERVSEATFRNNDIIKRIQTFREREQEQGSRASRLRNSLHSNSQAKRNIQGESELMRLSSTDKKDSVVSLINLDVGNSQGSGSTNKQKQRPKQKQKEEQKTVKKSQVIKQAETIKQNCRQCQQYILQINSLILTNKQLQEQILNIKYQNTQLKKLQRQRSQQLKKQIPKSKSGQMKHDTQQKGHIILQIPQEQQPLNRSEKLYQRINTLQSNINIMMDSSFNSSIIGKHELDQLIVQKSQRIHESKQGQVQAEQFFKMQKVKEQLVSVMQQLQQLIHECEQEPNGELLMQVNRKIKQQSDYINELQEQLSRLRLEIEDCRLEKQKLERMLRLQVRQQQTGSPYFRPFSQPISCIDHKITKNRINNILSSIRNFEDELHREDGGRTF